MKEAMERLSKIAKREEGQMILSNLMYLGTVRKEGKEYIGKASDGEEVSLGTEDYLDSLYSYLADFPDPSMW